MYVQCNTEARSRNHCCCEQAISTVLHIGLFVHACACVRVGIRARERVHAHACNSVANPARNAYAPYCDVICGPSVSTTFFYIMS
jgi:hypothetical protein